MTAYKKAFELIHKFKDHVNPYIGSSILSDTHDDSAIFFQCKQCAIISITETIETLSELIILGCDDSETISNERDHLILIRNMIKSLTYES